MLYFAVMLPKLATSLSNHIYSRSNYLHIDENDDRYILYKLEAVKTKSMYA